jgi:hypothetical protein
MLLLYHHLATVPAITDLRHSLLQEILSDYLWRVKGKSLGQNLFRLLLVKRQTGRDPVLAQLDKGFACCRMCRSGQRRKDTCQRNGQWILTLLFELSP